MDQSAQSNRLIAFIRNLPAKAEFCLIMLLCFGWSIGYAVWTWFSSERFQFTNGRLTRQVLLELLLLSVALWIGKVRGWSLATLGNQISWKGTGGGVLLFVVTYIVQLVVYLVACAVHPERIGFTSLPLSIPVILFVSVINPVFEEVLESGYFIHSLQRLGMWRTVLASALFRAVLHTYQGFNAALSMFALGLIFAFTYRRWRQLWPLILAHGFLDFLGFLTENQHAT